VVDAVRVGQHLGVALVDPDRLGAAGTLGGLQSGRVDLVVNLDQAAAQDQPQCPRRRHARVERDGDPLTALQPRYGEPHVPAVGERPRRVLVRSDDNLVVGAVLAPLPVLAHDPG
jgi:hypothetical protein